jgi:hypothetical protein
VNIQGDRSEAVPENLSREFAVNISRRAKELWNIRKGEKGAKIEFHHWLYERHARHGSVFGELFFFLS